MSYEGMRTTEANQVSSLLDLVGHAGDCEAACGAMGGLEDYKQTLINDDMFELLADLKSLEDLHGVHINYNDKNGDRCVVGEIRTYSCCGRKV